MMQARKSTFRCAIYAACYCAIAAACVPTTPFSSFSNGSDAATGPADAEPGTCWNKTETPAIIETVIEKVQVSPAQVNPDDSIREPAQYKNENRQVIVQPRQKNWYQIVCSQDMTPEFTATLQRALTARGFYAADTTGQLDGATRDAIARFQSSQNLPGSVLTVAAAQQLGLIALRRS